MILQFDEEGHHYTVDGRPAVSVTEITGQVTGKSLEGIDPEILEKARKRGEEIHKEIESEQPESEEAKWIAEQIEEIPVRFEVMVGGMISGTTIGGRIDGISELMSEIYDIKTGSSKDMLAWTIQLNLYRALAEQCFDIEILRLYVFWTPKSGKFKTVEIPILSASKIERIIDAYKYHGYLTRDFIDSEDDQTYTITLTGRTAEIDSVKKYLSILGIEYTIKGVL